MTHIRPLHILLALTALILLNGCNPIQPLLPSDPNQFKITYHYTMTDDNISLALRRYRLPKFDQTREPVILCHGLSYNMYFWDLGNKVSLPRYLAKNGYDVWLVSLRGAAPSSQPVNSGLRKLSRLNLDPAMFANFKDRLTDIPLLDWSVDDHIRHDVPAAIDYVKKQTNHKRVHWIGHSMGGMVMFGYLQLNPDPDQHHVRSFVAAAVPMTVFHPLSKPYQFLIDNEGFVGVGSRLVGTSTAAAVNVILGDVGTPTDRLFFNSDNIDGGILRGLFYFAEEEISPGQLKQLLHMVRTEKFTSIDKSIDYTAGLSSVSVPTCFLVGTVDNMATPAAVKYAFRSVNASRKGFHLFGRVNYHTNDYGHDDLIIGKNARNEVYPVVLDWLKHFRISPHTEKLSLQPGRNIPPADLEL